MLKTEALTRLSALFVVAMVAMMLMPANSALAGNDTGVCGISHRLLNYADDAISPELLADRLPVDGPMLADISAVKFAPMATLLPINITGTSELYVQRLAERRHRQRITGGVVGLLLGGACVGLGVAVDGDETLSSDDRSLVTALYVVGGLSAGIGIFSLAVPSRAEREFDNVMMVSDPVKREKAGHQVLISLAEDYKRDRMIAGVLYLGMGVYFMTARPFGGEETTWGGTTTGDYDYLNDINAATYAVIGLWSLLAKSHEEKALERYTLEIADGNGLDFRFGPIKGGIGTALVYNF